MAGGVVLPAAVSGIGAAIISSVSVGGTFMVITMLGLHAARRIGGTVDGVRHIAALTTAFALGQIAGPAFG